MENNEEIIDFVIPWVDGNDPEWQKEKAKYDTTKKTVNNNNARYRDWDNLQYWFRGVEKYAPWVHKIYFITWGHLPKWLNTDNPKLVVVNHKDYIPKEYLPTFSANPIELNVHRIKGLSEQFVFFNDDVFLVNITKPTDFFKDGKPCDSAILNTHCPVRNESIYDIQINNVRIINSYFDMKKNMKEHRKNWFSFKYKLFHNATNLVFSTCKRYPGFQPLHVCNSFLKSTFEELWEKEFEVLDMTSRRKLRSALDVNQYLIKDWQIASNNFYPSKKSKESKVIYMPEYNLETLKNVLKKTFFGKKLKYICINDGNLKVDFETLKKLVNSKFEMKFPEKSSFEK